ncbi:hypothetical protein Mgra_00001645 [Meloidogyne graminicola]|uniref:Uncharacterized protein n=1 Tax=Meloidogyne graminicola TaxID=189291 RepID=A0A8S9ZYX4_9BILA|nr:hypothetical protein Mgra_00001645 [Meloidogyne graminicola]
MSSTLSPKNSQEGKLKCQLEREISLLKEELNHTEINNQKLRERYEEEYSKLLEDRMENENLSTKINTITGIMTENELKLKRFEIDSEKDDKSLDYEITKFRNSSIEQNNLLNRLYSNLQSDVLSDEDHYGDMSKYKIELRQKVDNAKCEYSFCVEELKHKKEILSKLDLELAEIDQTLTPELKSEIVEATVNIMKSRRKRLLDLKMSNHSMKLQCI